MKRRFPGVRCEGCKRLIDGQFSWRCWVCANRYTEERRAEAELYRYGNAVLTAAEWAKVLGVSRGTIYRLIRKHGTIGNAVRATGRRGYVEAVLNGRKREE